MVLGMKCEETDIFMTQVFQELHFAVGAFGEGGVGERLHHFLDSYWLPRNHVISRASVAASWSANLIRKFRQSDYM